MPGRSEVLDEIFDLFLELGADDELADFPVHLRQRPRRLRHARPGRAGHLDAAAAGPGAGADSRARDRRRRAAANARHHARLVRLRRPHRRRADLLRHDRPRAAGRPDASRAIARRPARWPRCTRSTSWAARKSKRPRPATSWPWWGSRRSRSATRSATPTTAAPCRAWPSTSRPCR